MACLGIRHGGVGGCVNRNHGGDYINQRSDRVSGFTHITIPNLSVKVPNHRLSTAINATAACDTGRDSALSLFDRDINLRTKQIGDNEYSDRTSIESPRVSEKLDEWMRDSVTEIVKNIKQTPFFIQIYADGEVETKKALPEKDWRNAAKHKSSSLEGLILVEELKGNTDPVCSGEEDDGTRAFGVLIQGKTKGRGRCKSTCYLLKTSSINGGGLGHICTHFCLMKVQSFHRNAFSQFNDCWLVQE